MRKIYFNGYLISLTDHDWFQDRYGNWNHLVIQEQTQEPERKEWCEFCGVSHERFNHQKEKPVKKECEPLIGALARAYCTKENSGKVVDVTLIKAMADEARKWAVEVVNDFRKGFEKGGSHDPQGA